MRAFFWIVAAVVVCSVLSASGCVDLAKVESMKAEAVKLRELAREEGALWEAQVAALSPGDPLRVEAQAAMEAMRAKESALAAAIQGLERVIEDAKAPSDPVVSVTAPLLPEPLRSPYLLGAALAAAVARLVQVKRGLASVARSFEKAMEEDEGLREGVKRSANTLRSIQTPTAQRIVDQATGKGLALPI
jgi:hypothetical protein